VLVPLAAALVYALALQPALDALDRALTDTAVALAQIVEVKDGRAALPLGEQTARALRADLVDETVFAVGDAGGRLLGGSAELLAATAAPPVGQWRFTETRLDGRAVRVAAFGKACGDAGATCVVAVAETLGKRDQAQGAALVAAALAGVALALPLAGLAMLAVGRALRPLGDASGAVRALGPERLEPLDAAGVPREAQDFAHAVNGLLARLAHAAAAQRAFVSDAAHQLRTPLAVLRLEAAEARRRFAHDDAFRPTLERLHAAAERSARLAHQLLALARTEGTSLEPVAAMEPVDLADLARAGADRWLAASLAAGQDLGYDLAPARVLGHRVLLAEGLENLVQNALAHAGPGVRVTVRTGSDAEGSWLAVEDDGCGVAADEREALWQRFRRGRDAAGEGSGLGLAIVSDVARLHGGTATLEPGAGGRGLLARVRLPALNPPP
jgi:two-component system sensor histidine kinase TctE